MAVAAVTLAAAFLFVACEQSDAFACGTPLASDPAIVRSCSRPHEACICQTNSCAIAGDTTCPSGYRYVEAPFAKGALAGQCVMRAHVDWIVPVDSAEKCSALPPSESDAASTEGGESTDGEGGSAPADAESEGASR
jgi:hypothetical protein